MIPNLAVKAGLFATLALLFPCLLFVLTWGRRISRRLRLLEAASQRAQDERSAIPEPLSDFELDITMPRFIGSPHPPRRAQ